ncbi:MAG: hypothetical protein NTW86_24530, partial [Candidatus Sumerlaeota bacterium]|nr:hypothetical protein [Candidatus Sumerlaeota bacterium]
IADGLAVFGARDGWVYAVRAADGQLAWRLRAAPAERWLVSYDRLESPWPVSGSVLVENGPSAGSGQAVAYCAAGRTSYLDDGMTLCKIELATGRLLAEKTYYSRDPDSGRPVNLYEPRYTDVLGGRELPGLLPDVLSADAANLYMRGVAIGRDLAIQEEQNQSHIYSSLGFLDDSWWERSYWIFGEHFYSGLAARFVAGFRAPAGKLLTADDQTVYAYLDSDLAKGLMMKTPGLFAESKTPALTEKVMKGKTQAGKGKLRNVSTATVAPAWSVDTPFYGVSMAIAGDTLFVAGPQRGNEVEAAQYLAECPTNECVPPPVAQSALDAFNGKQGSTIWAVNKSDGAQRAAFRLESRPVFDGLIAAQGRLFITTTDGKALCLGPGAAQPLPPAGDSAAVSPSSDSSAGKSPASANSRKASKADKPRKEGGKRRASRDKAA